MVANIKSECIFVSDLKTTKAKIMKNTFLATRPNATVTEKKNAKGEIIVYVNGQAAFNMEDRNNAANWLTMMENAYQRSLAK